MDCCASALSGGGKLVGVKPVGRCGGVRGRERQLVCGVAAVAGVGSGKGVNDGRREAEREDSSKQSVEERGAPVRMMRCCGSGGVMFEFYPGAH